MTATPARAIARVAAVAVTGVALLALGTLPASAHVRVSAPDASAGSYADLTFRVPTEKDTASTTALQVVMPTAQPLASVSVQPHPGWRAVVHKRNLPQPLQTDDGPVSQVVSDVVWTADSPQSAIAPGQFDQFSVLAGPLPNVASLAFPANQTYSDGEVVAWNQTAAPGAPEPAHPSPELKLTAGDAPAGDGPSVTATAADSSSDSTPLVLAVVALVIAVVALVGLVVALVRGRRG